jgi:hypothetical protein
MYKSGKAMPGGIGIACQVDIVVVQLDPGLTGRCFVIVDAVVPVVE